MGSISPALHGNKKKVVFVMGSTGTGKSKLAIHLAVSFAGEVINSDKMQVYKGLDIVTNKVSPEELELVPHHLISIVEPETDFTAEDFCREATAAIDEVAGRGKLPIVAGGSNSYIEALVDDQAGDFRAAHDCCFLWVDVESEVLFDFVSDRVEKMLAAGLLEEMRGIYSPGSDNSSGVRRSIGIPEFHEYFDSEATADLEERDALFDLALIKMKANTCDLTERQVEKINLLGKKPGWNIHRLSATPAFLAAGEAAEAAWQSNVAQPAFDIVTQFVAGAY